MSRGLPGVEPDPRPASVTIGSYDGVHRGHRALLRRLTAEARSRGTQAVVITFDPHPRCVVGPDGCPALLTSVAERTTLLRAAGADRVVTLPFTPELSRWSAEAFSAALLASFELRCLVVGPGFALGRNRVGDLPFLRSFGAGHGFDVVAVPPLRRAGLPVSSSRIRQALVEGRVGEAKHLLGRPYALGGTVVRGRGVGGRLRFPTANLAPDPGRCVPAGGVYAGWLEIGGAWRQAAASIGTRPTFGTGPETVEAFVLDFAGDLYGARTRLAFARRLRGERRFESEASLTAAIQRDVERVRRALDVAPEPA